MISCLNEIFIDLISVLIFSFYFLFCSILERKNDKSFKRDIIVLISSPISFVSTSFLVNIGKEMSLAGFRTYRFRRYAQAPLCIARLYQKKNMSVFQI